MTKVKKVHPLFKDPLAMAPLQEGFRNCFYTHPKLYINLSLFWFLPSMAFIIFLICKSITYKLIFSLYCHLLGSRIQTRLIFVFHTDRVWQVVDTLHISWLLEWVKEWIPLILSHFRYLNCMCVNGQNQNHTIYPGEGKAYIKHGSDLNDETWGTFLTSTPFLL